MRFRDRATIEIEAHVARLQGSVASIEHHERPAYLDRLQLLREQVFLLNHFYDAFFSTIGMVGRIVITVVLLMSINPLLVLLVAFAVPSVLVSSWRAGVERRTEEAAAPNARLGPAPVRPRDRGRARQGDPRRRDERSRSSSGATKRGTRGTPTSPRERWASARWHTAAWTLFGLAYVGAVVWVASGLNESPGNVALALAAGANLSRYLGVTVGQAEFLRWTLDAAQRLAWLEEYAAAARGRARPAGARTVDRRDPLRGRVVPVSRAPTRGCCATSTSSCTRDR